LVGKNSVVADFYVLVGDKVSKPEYKKQLLSEYNGNPLIEALPPIFSKNNVLTEHIKYPEVPDSIDQIPAEIRYQMLQRIKEFYLPPVEFVDIERRLSSLVRMGYTARNPVKNKKFINMLQKINDVKLLADEEKVTLLANLQAPNRTSASSFSVIGVSGIGKTTAIEKILLMYPQVIYHSSYNDEPFTRTQLVWLKIDCPYDGSLKTLCRSFFSAVDNVLGTTNYFQKYGNPRNSTALMMVHMAYVAALHSIGIFIIDEIQHLLAPKVNSEEMLNFFVTLVNTIGVPVFYIGTYKAMKILNRDFRQARRIGTEGVLMWDRMKRDRKWSTFIQALWKFQYLNEYTELTDSLDNTMYYLSQGITSVAVSIFMIAQKRAIEREECITERLLHVVYDNELAMIKPMLNALRNNNIRDLAKYEDLVINIDELMFKRTQENDAQDIITALAAQKQAGQRMSQRESAEPDNMALTETIAGKSDKVIRLKVFAKDDLRKLHNKAIEKKVNTYMVLKDAGYIKDPLRELVE